MDDILFVEKDIKYIIPQSQYDWAIKEGVIGEDSIFIPSPYIPDDAIVEVDINTSGVYSFDEEEYGGLTRHLHGEVTPTSKRKIEELLGIQKLV